MLARVNGFNRVVLLVGKKSNYFSLSCSGLSANQIYWGLQLTNKILLWEQNEQQKTSVLELTVFIYLFLMVYSMFDKCIVCYCWWLWSYYGPVARGLHLQSPLRSTSSLQTNPSWYMYITMYLKKNWSFRAVVPVLLNLFWMNLWYWNFLPPSTEHTQFCTYGITLTQSNTGLNQCTVIYNCSVWWCKVSQC